MKCDKYDVMHILTLIGGGLLAAGTRIPMDQKLRVGAIVTGIAVEIGALKMVYDDIREANEELRETYMKVDRDEIIDVEYKVIEEGA